MRKTVIAAALLLSACETASFDLTALQPSDWTQKEQVPVQMVEAESLRGWWIRFDDPALNSLIDATMETSPDRREAEAHLLEARGNWRTARATLFPLLTARGNIGRQDLSQADAGSFYDATFDASYEFDIFGSRSRVGAVGSFLDSAEASYQAVTLALIAEVARNYIQYRTFEAQAHIAQWNLEIQQKTLELIRRQKEAGAAPRLDVERAANLVATTRASVPEFRRQADAARLRLTVLTGLLPEQVAPLLASEGPIPGAGVTPVLTAPAEVITLRPDVRAAAANLAARTNLSQAAVAEMFPTFTLGGFFGIEESAMVSSTQIWSVALGAAVTLLDFGRIQGRIDAARAREAQAYENLRKTVLQAVTDVETSLSDYARVNEQLISLRQAQANAQKSLDISGQLYKEGEISFLDVLDAQRTANEADAAVVSAESALALALVALYKSLGMY